MKKLKSKVSIKPLILLFFFFFYSCHNGKVDKEYKILIVKDETKKVIKKAQYYLNKNKDTIFNGVVIFYHKNGAISDSFFVIDNAKEGSYYEFDSTSTLKSKFNLENNKLNGMCEYYFNNGQVENEKYYIKDSLIFSKSFFLNGKLKQYFKFVNNEHVSYYVIYDSLGNKIDESGDSTIKRQMR